MYVLQLWLVGYVSHPAHILAAAVFMQQAETNLALDEGAYGTAIHHTAGLSGHAQAFTVCQT